MVTNNCLVVIPVFNESKNIKKVIDEIRKYFKNILVVDDGSNDDSISILTELHVLSLRHLINLGQGAALETAFEYFIGIENFEYLITFDGDGQNSAFDAFRMFKLANSKKLDAVIGSRFINNNSVNEIPLIKKLTLKLGILYEKIIFGTNLTDAHNGLRVLSKNCVRDALLPINNFDMSHATEISFKLFKNKCNIQEFHVKVNYKNMRSQSPLNAINIAINNIFRSF